MNLEDAINAEAKEPEEFIELTKEEMDFYVTKASELNWFVDQISAGGGMNAIAAMTVFTFRMGRQFEAEKWRLANSVE